MALIKLSDIKMPEHYVRGKIIDGRTVGGINGKNVNDLIDVVVKANSKFLKDENKSDWHDLIGKKLDWPFHTPILLVKDKAPPEPKDSEEPEESKKNKKAKNKGPKFRPYELIDGNHRLTVWRKLGQKEIEATIKQIDDPAERFLEQYRTNASHGLRLDKDSRDNAIRVAHDVFKISLTNLAKEANLNRSSIIRILAEKQRSKEPRKKPKALQLNQPRTTDSDMSVNGFIERIEILLTAFTKIAPELEKQLMETPKSNYSKLTTIATRINAIAILFKKPTEPKPVKEPTPETLPAA